MITRTCADGAEYFHRLVLYRLLAWGQLEFHSLGAALLCVAHAGIVPAEGLDRKLWHHAALQPNCADCGSAAHRSPGRRPIARAVCTIDAAAGTGSKNPF